MLNRKITDLEFLNFFQRCGYYSIEDVENLTVGDLDGLLKADNCFLLSKLDGFSMLKDHLRGLSDSSFHCKDNVLNLIKFNLREKMIELGMPEKSAIKQFDVDDFGNFNKYFPLQKVDQSYTASSLKSPVQYLSDPSVLSSVTNNYSTKRGLNGAFNEFNSDCKNYEEQNQILIDNSKEAKKESDNIFLIIAIILTVALSALGIYFLQNQDTNLDSPASLNSLPGPKVSY